MTDGVLAILDELEKARAIMAFLKESTAALLKDDSGAAQGEPMVSGMIFIYHQLDAKFENIINQVEALQP